MVDLWMVIGSDKPSLAGARGVRHRGCASGAAQRSDGAANCPVTGRLLANPGTGLEQNPKGCGAGITACKWGNSGPLPTTTSTAWSNGAHRSLHWLVNPGPPGVKSNAGQPMGSKRYAVSLADESRGGSTEGSSRMA